MGRLKVCLQLHPLDRYDDHDEDHGYDDHDEEADDDEGDHEGFEGYEESPRQDRQQGFWKESRGRHEKKGVGLFAPKTLSPALAAICGGKSMPRTEVTKKIWVYIKKNKLNNGRTIKPDATLKAVFPVASVDMLKLAGYVSKHLS